MMALTIFPCLIYSPTAQMCENLPTNFWDKKMFYKAISLLCVSAILAGCAGRAANPVTVRQMNDNNKSCSMIQYEMSSIENNIQTLIPQSDKTGKNVALGIGGLFIWPMWLFMDLSSAEKEEINAYRMRHDHLLSLAQEKGCGTRMASK
tara:strand:- start:54749 stop:55195 length:447 start_codon:yes stop_codon:yes gene_type:complete